MLCAIIVILLLIIFPNNAAMGAVRGLSLCASAVIPSLFPFFVATRLLTSKLPNISSARLGRVFGVSPNVIPALLISFLGGYPVGVATVTSMYEEGRLKKHEAEEAIVFCNNSGPGFFVGMIGSIVLNSVKAGLTLYAIHVFSAVICSTLFRQKSKTTSIQRITKTKQSFAQAFSGAITSSCSAILQVCALVILFSVITELFRALGLLSALPGQFQALLCGLLEMTSGISMLKGSHLAFVFCAFLMGWGGMCVHMQAMCLWQKVGLRPRGYFLEKLLHGLISALLALSYQIELRIFLICMVSFLLICVIFPQIRQKWGGKKKKLVV